MAYECLPCTGECKAHSGRLAFIPTHHLTEPAILDIVAEREDLTEDDIQAFCYAVHDAVRSYKHAYSTKIVAAGIRILYEGEAKGFKNIETATQIRRWLSILGPKHAIEITKGSLDAEADLKLVTDALLYAPARKTLRGESVHWSAIHPEASSAIKYGGIAAFNQALTNAGLQRGVPYVLACTIVLAGPGPHPGGHANHLETWKLSRELEEVAAQDKEQLKTLGTLAVNYQGDFTALKAAVDAALSTSLGSAAPPARKLTSGTRPEPAQDSGRHVAGP